MQRSTRRGCSVVHWVCGDSNDMGFVHVFNVRELAVILILTCSFGNTQQINNVSPKIDSTKEEIVVQSGNNFSLRCEGKKQPVVWNYTLVPQDLPHYFDHVYNILQRSNTTSNTFNKPNDVPYKSELTVTGANYTDTGFFYCLYQDTTNFDDSRNVAKVYIYVNSSIHLLIYEHEATFILAGYETMPLEIPCKPTSPDVEVTLFKDNVQLYPPKNGSSNEEKWKFNPYRGFYVDHATNSHAGFGYVCKATAPYAEDVHSLDFTVQIIQDHPGGLPKPVIQDASQGYATVGENITLICSVIFDIGSLIQVEWIQASEVATKENRSIATMLRETIGSAEKRRINRTLVIQNVSKTDEGNYTCRVSDHKHNESVTTFLKINEHNETYIKLSAISNITENATFSALWVVTFDANPNPETIWQKPNGDMVKQDAKYQIRKERKSSMLNISDLSLDDAGVYTFTAKSGIIHESRKFTLNVRDKPKVQFRSESRDILLVGKNFTLTCHIKAYPKAEIVFRFRPCSPLWNCSNDFTPLNGTGSNQEKCEEEKGNEYLTVQHKVMGIANKSGEYLCRACNNNTGCTNSTVKVIVSDVADGFKLTGPGDNPAETTDVTLTCSLSLFKYQKSVEWFYTNEQGNETKLDGTYSSPGTIFSKGMATDLSYEDTLVFPNIRKADSGSYKCRVVNGFDNKAYNSTPVNFTVLDLQAPEIFNQSYQDGIVTANPGNEVEMMCQARGVPLPTVEWLKDGEIFNAIDTKDAISVVNLKYVKPENAGTYTCTFTNKAGSDQITFTLTVEAEHTSVSPGVITGVVLAALIFLGLLAVLLYKIYQEKQRASCYNVKSLDAFLSGDLSSINPDLPIDEQADLLPYDKRWEFPSDRLKLGKQLGSGAFGRVLKGEAMGITESEATTVVAVKMVKTHANYSAFKALLSEVKIMIHLGSHLNVVNLLGACTKNFTKGELLVIVEYCRFGNIQNYLIRHRDEFTSQIDPIRGTFDPTIGAEKYAVLAAAAANAAGLAEKDPLRPSSTGPRSPGACSTTSASSSTFPNESDTGTTYVAGSIMPNYQVDSSGQLLGGINSSGSQTQAPWRSNYKGDYRDTAGPLNTRDLLCWGFQIARGMEYLSSRKVLHGDLAARNILLAENNVVKICDFGLAREVYKNGGNYKKKGDGPLPVKWMAVESISDLVFSTQSDVWSFGIVLWEIFSLGKTPYPDMQADEMLYKKLQSGYHMECPKYATKDVYDIMVNCWQLDPRSRPSFTELQERLGGLLEASVRLQYINLNDPYISLNKDRRMEDYLDMIRQPDYANVASSPGPVDYANLHPQIDVDSQRISSYVTMSPSVLSTPIPAADNQQTTANNCGYMFMNLPSKAEKTDNVIQEGKRTKFNFDFNSKSRELDGNKSDAEMTLMTTNCASPLGIHEISDDTPLKLLHRDVVQQDSGFISPSRKNSNLNNDPDIFRSSAMAQNTEPSYYNLKQIYSPK